jgi:NAD-dependent dihydropyrimidine dehydrogenase PreA subunit
VAYKITEECLACGICIDECPNSAISEGDSIMVIDANACSNCGSCKQACPNEAIVEE